MRHVFLASNGYYGVGVNWGETNVLLQLGVGMEQLRIRFTSEEIDKLIKDLRETQKILKKEEQDNG